MDSGEAERYITEAKKARNLLCSALFVVSLPCRAVPPHNSATRRNGHPATPILCRLPQVRLGTDCRIPVALTIDHYNLTENMKKFLAISLASLLLSAGSLLADGNWKAYMSYFQPTEIEQASGNILYVLASNGLYSYNQNDHSLTTYDRVNRLSDCTVSHIAWNPQARRLVIAYDNGNIDLMDNSGNVVNMTDFLNSSATSKTINDILCDGVYAYLSTGIGVLKLNVAQAEVSDTYSLGFEVDYSYLENGYFYAASKSRGIYRALLTDNLLDKNVWTRVGNYVARAKTMDPDLLAVVRTLQPGGPRYNHFSFMRFKNNRLYTVGGGSIDGFNATPQVLQGDSWTILQDSLQQQTQTRYVGSFSIDAPTGDPNHIFTTGQFGVMEYQDGRFVKHYSYDNSPLEVAQTVKDKTNRNYTVVYSGMCDTDGSYWCFNSIAPTRQLLRLNADGTWSQWTNTDLLSTLGCSMEQVEDIMRDSRGLLWMGNNFYRVPALICFQPSTETFRIYKSFVNEDGQSLTITQVTCVAEDLDNNIWIGTNAGPLLLYPNDIAEGSTVFTQVKVPRNDGTNLADYLLADVNISCMAVDRANRKWFGTAENGVYCIGSDNISEVYHFTTDNSPLLSNDIQSIAINSTTGEVYIGTEKGLCSYMSDANTASDGMTKDNVWAYPNPVKPEYTGPVTIRGLEDGASVTIVTSSGKLVNKGMASGGQYKWYAQDMDNKRVASGMYMVLVATASGDKGVVCKVAVVN